MKKAVIDPAVGVTGSSYPPPHNEAVAGRKTWPLTRQFGLSQFGVNRVELAPGSWSTQEKFRPIVVRAGEWRLRGEGEPQ